MCFLMNTETIYVHISVRRDEGIILKSRLLRGINQEVKRVNVFCKLISVALSVISLTPILQSTVDAEK